MSTGTAAPAPNPNGRFVEGLDNFFCAFCHSYVQAPPGKGLRECPTANCERTTGFGVFANTPRPTKRPAASAGP